MSKTCCPPSTGNGRYDLAVIGAGSAGFSQRTASTTEVAKLVRRHLDTEQELLTSVKHSYGCFASDSLLEGRELGSNLLQLAFA